MKNEEKQAVSLGRRDFLKGAAFAGGAAALAGLAGCAPSAGGEKSMAQTGSAEDVAWDEEYDFVVVGGGCGAFGAALAANTGASVLLVEKGSSAGGTTAFSGNGMWAPVNWIMPEISTGEDAAHTADTEADIESIIEYALKCDAFNIAEEELVRDYVTNVAPVLKNMGEALDIEYAYLPMPDYYGFEGAKEGRCIGFAKDGELTSAATYPIIIEPLLERLGIEVRTNTEGKRLIQDASGAVVGVTIAEGSKTKNVKANRGVLLNTGGFEHNEEMAANYLRHPFLGCNSVTTNTGDGHRMGLDVGADLRNMASVWGVPFYQVSEDAAPNENLCDWLTWRYGDHSIIVNKYGKRFGDETAAYAPANLAYGSYNSRTYELENIPGFQIGDQSYVSLYNYPGVTETDIAATAGAIREGIPEWVQVYDTLDELAADQGIDPEGLKEEVARWNAFCDAGVDEDFGRPSSIWTHGIYFIHEDETCMGKIETPPFFCAKIVPGTCGTNGGLRVNADAQVLNRDGEVIPGLYASGNCSASYFGSAYPGGGSTVGGGVYRAARAANHAFDLGLTA